jgi:DNA-binding transcriptional LysR family regulator
MLQKSLIRRLDLMTLQLFVAVHEEGTLTRAAAREAIAVSAASKRLMELEEALGISLFVRQAGKVLRLRIHVPGFDAMCRMVQANMGIGILLQKAYELFGRALGLHAVPLTDDWSDRALIIVVRDEAALSPVSRMLFEKLRRAV